MAEQGMVHLIMGDGAGKTTAAFGSALRFCAYGQRVLIVQFLKWKPSGECIAIQAVTGVDVLVTGKSNQFFPDMTAEERHAEQAAAVQAMALARKKMESGTYGMIVLDEAGGAVQDGLLPEQQLLDFVTAQPRMAEIVLTGRYFSSVIKEKANYISEICNRKHPYEEGLPARRGIEF